MKKNISTPDKFIRYAIAFGIGGLFLGGVITGIPMIIALLVAIVLLVTALSNRCPLYAIFGISTAGKTVAETATPDADIPVIKSDPHKGGGCCGECGSED